MKKSEKKHTISFSLADPNNTPLEDLQKLENGPKTSPLVKSILNVLNGPKDSIERLAFETDPTTVNQYQSIYRAKLKLIPDHFLKRIAIQDDLVAAILNARSNQIGSFGRLQRDRFSAGLTIKLKPEYEDYLSDEDKEKVQQKIRAASKLLTTCGNTTGWKDQEQMSFSEYLFISTRNGLTVGRIATEVVYTMGPDGKRKFHSFRPIDAGTIFIAAPQKDAEEKVRENARFLLEQLKNKKLVPEKFHNDEYAWVQVIEGKPVQAFTSEECMVYNLYQVADVEMEGYPITPIDTAISAVTTHINITTHNKLYFQNGRASRGMLVIKSEDVTDEITNQMRQHFNASINNVNNSWRMPVFGINKDEEITWQAIDTAQKDMEFQYLSDNNARVILSAFQMSPEELPGYAHLSRGTNNQALSESNQEYKLEAHRDLGIRPLLARWEDFINANLFPLVDAELSKIAEVRLAGIDADTPEKESIRLQQDGPVHMTYDETLQKVDKKPVGKEWGGSFPFNPGYQAILDKYFFVGEIMEYFFGKKGAAQDQRFQYIRDPFFFNWMQLMQAQQQAEQQQQAAAQQQQAAAQQQQQQAQSDKDAKDKENETDLSRAADQAQGELTKSEAQLPPSKRRLVVQQKKLVDHIMKEWESESEKTLKEIVDIADHHLPTSLKN